MLMLKKYLSLIPQSKSNDTYEKTGSLFFVCSGPFSLL